MEDITKKFKPVELIKKQVTENIEQVTVLPCGSCKNNLARIFKEKTGERVFPANAFLIKHKKYGYILFDTGYSKDVLEQGWKSKIYNAVNPVNLDTPLIDEWLDKLGIKANEIKLIILSHLHPDHIGGIKYFPEVKLFMTEQAKENLKKSKLLDLVFKGLMSGTQEIVSCEEPKYAASEPTVYFGASYDILGDKSLLGISLKGHSKGQMGLYIPEHKILLGADASWGSDLSVLDNKIKRLPKLIISNYSRYRATQKALKYLQEEYKNIKIIYSHEFIGE